LVRAGSRYASTGDSCGALRAVCRRVEDETAGGVDDESDFDDRRDGAARPRCMAECRDNGAGSRCASTCDTLDGHRRDVDRVSLQRAACEAEKESGIDDNGRLVRAGSRYAFTCDSRGALRAGCRRVYVGTACGISEESVIGDGRDGAARSRCMTEYRDGGAGSRCASTCDIIDGYRRDVGRVTLQRAACEAEKESGIDDNSRLVRAGSRYAFTCDNCGTLHAGCRRVDVETAGGVDEESDFDDGRDGAARPRCMAECRDGGAGLRCASTYVRCITLLVCINIFNAGRFGDDLYRIFYDYGRICLLLYCLPGEGTLL